MLNRDEVRKAITDAYYDARNAGNTMEYAATRATDKVMKLIPCICNTGPDTEGPEEDCPSHGRPYRYWVERSDNFDSRLQTVQAVLAQYQLESTQFTPQKFKTGQEHLSPAFREVNWREACVALGEMWNRFERDIGGALEGAFASEEEWAEFRARMGADPEVQGAVEKLRKP